jgi:hypothetical protein
MNQVFYTYLYRDPKEHKPIYVGKGQKKRAWSHFTKTANLHLKRLIAKRLNEGHTIEPIINYEVDESTAFHMEMFWIDFYGREDLGTGTLFNLTDGGDQPPSRKGKVMPQPRHPRPPKTEETKVKMSLALAGKPWSEARRLSFEESKAAGRIVSESTRKKLSFVHTGRKHTDESRLNMSKAMKGRPAPNKGIKHTAESKALMSAKRKEYWEAKRSHQ